MSEYDVYIFANPIAGRGRGRAIAGQLARALHAEGLRPTVVLEKPETIDRTLLGRNVRAAIAIGGDGTIRGVARHLWDHCVTQNPVEPPNTPLLIVPMGTANLLGKHLGIRWSPKTIAQQVTAAVKQMRLIHLDAACLNEQLFLLMAGVGIDAHIVHELDRMRRGPITLASYVLPAASAMGFYSFPPLTVTIDGKIVCRDLPAMAFVGNIAEYGTGFPVLPHARPDDSLLDVCVMPCRTRLDVARLFLLAASGEHATAEGVIYRKGKQVKIESSTPAPVQVDGEAAGHTPIDIRLLHMRVPFIVP